jgi:hypothetical protein
MADVNDTANRPDGAEVAAPPPKQFNGYTGARKRQKEEKSAP